MTQLAQEAPPQAPGSAVPPNPSSGIGDQWKTLYGGLDGLDDRVSPVQRSAFQALDRTTQEPKETRARAINQTYVEKQLAGKLDPAYIESNWEAVKSEYAKKTFGMDQDSIPDTALYSKIGEQFQPHDGNPWTLIKLGAQVDGQLLAHWHNTIGAAPLKDLPDAPVDKLPNIPIPFLPGNITIKQAGMAWNILKPQLEGLETPESIVALGTGTALGEAAAAGSKAASVALKGMSGVFGVVMAKAAKDGAANIARIQADPNHTPMDLAKAYASEASNVFGGLAGAFGTLPEGTLSKVLGLLKGRDVKEAPTVMQEHAMDPKTPPEEKVATLAAAEQVHAIASDPMPKPLPPEEPLPENKEKVEELPPDTRPGGAGFGGTDKPIPFDKPPEEPKSEEPKKEEPPITGAAAEKIVGLKHEWGDAEMKSMGMDPNERGDKLSRQQALDWAANELQKDPMAGKKLVDSLVKKNRAIDGKEDMLLLSEVNRRALDRDAAETELIEAKKSNDPDRIASADVKVAHTTDAFIEASEAATKVGAPQAQGLAFRQFMMKRDYSLASMERQMTNASPDGKITPEERDAIRGLSKHIRETAGEIEKHVGKKKTNTQAMIKGSLKSQIAHLDDQIQKGERVTKKVGKTKLDDEGQRLKELRDSLKSAYDVMFPDKDTELTPEQQLTRALSAKDRQIEELQRQIDTQEPFAPGKKLPSEDPQMAAKQAQIDALKEEREYLRDSLQTPKDPPTDLEARSKELDGRIKAIEKQLKDEAPFSKGKKSQPSSPEIEAKEKTLEALKQQREFLRDRLQPREDPKTDAEIRLQNYKTRTAKSTKDLLDRTARGDDSPKPKPEPIILDHQAELLKAEHERAKQAFDDMVRKKRYDNMSLPEKAALGVVKWRRAFVLSRIATLGKLTAAAMWRMFVQTPLEEVTATGLSKLPGVSKVAEGAPRRGAMNVTALANAYADALTKGAKDAYDTLKTGKSNLDVLYGKRRDPAVGETEMFGREVANFAGTLHGALKSVVKRFEFSLSLRKRLAQYAKAKIDISNPAVQQRAEIEAYKDANRAIFLQDSVVNDIWKGATAAADRGGPVGKTIGAGMKTAVPITKVPLNVAGEAIEHMTGVGTGSVRLGVAMRKGFESLNGEQKDVIMRELTKGTLGLGGLALLIGFFSGKDSPIKLGGLYETGEKRKPGELKAGEASVYGHVVPSYLLDNPLMLTLQVGQTAINAANGKLRKKDRETQGWATGIGAAALGLIDSTPVGQSMTEFGEMFGGTPAERNYKWDEFVKGMAIPGGIDELAKHLDKDSKGDVIQRKPRDLKEHIETGIPGLRKDVPKRKTSTTSTYQ